MLAKACGGSPLLAPNEKVALVELSCRANQKKRIPLFHMSQTSLTGKTRTSLVIWLLEVETCPPTMYIAA